MNISDVEDELLINKVWAIMSAIKKTFKTENKDEQEQQQRKSTIEGSPMLYPQMIEQREKNEKNKDKLVLSWAKLRTSLSLVKTLHFVILKGMGTKN